MRFPGLVVVAAAASIGVLSSSARAGVAEACPEPSTDDAAAKRAMARTWFTRAEEAEAAGDPQTAARRYACALKLVPHPSTAYNMGTAAEKAGDLSLAVDAFRMYLDLAPGAADRPAVEERIARLDARLAELRQQLQRAPTEPNTGGANHLVTAPSPPENRSDPHRHRRAGWITFGGAIGAIGTGVVFNLVARSKMRDCNQRFDADPQGALAQCDAAKPLAYGSYALLGVGAALGVTAAVLLLWTEDSPGPTVGVVPASEGALLLASGRF